MDLFSINDLKELVKEVEFPAISIFIPTHRSGDQFQQDIIRFKNQIQRIEKELSQSGFKTNEVDKILQPAKDLLEPKEFWFQQRDGLAVFISKGLFKTFRVPLAFKEFSFVNKRFYTKPLLPLLSGDGRFFILDLDLKELKLYEGSKFSLNRIELPEDTPAGFDEAMKYDDPEKSLQLHTGVPFNGGGSRAGIFHGHGSGRMDDTVYKEKILEFFHMAEKGIHEKIRNENIPLLLAGVEYLIPIYKKANAYPHLMDESLSTNTDDMKESELHKKAWEKMEPFFNKGMSDAWDKYNEYLNKEMASNNIEDIVKSSQSNRIETLFINPDAHAWGTYNAEKNEVKVFTDDKRGEDLIDLAAVQTALNGGQIYALSPNARKDLDAAAVYRY